MFLSKIRILESIDISIYVFFSELNRQCRPCHRGTTVVPGPRNKKDEVEGDKNRKQKYHRSTDDKVRSTGGRSMFYYFCVVNSNKVPTDRHVVGKMMVQLFQCTTSVTSSFFITLLYKRSSRKTSSTNFSPYFPLEMSLFFFRSIKNTLTVLFFIYLY